MRRVSKKTAQITKLFEAVNIGSLRLKNRIVMAPMGTRYTTRDGFITKRSLAYYAARAKGGAGLIVVEVSNATSLSQYPGMLSVSDDKYVPGLKSLAEVIHSLGARAALQILAHKGRRDQLNPLSPSDIPDPATGRMPRVPTIDDIKRLVQEFGEGARRAKEAGFDAVGIHGASGYLVLNFLSPRLNHRTDRYGGDVRGRARFALELVEVTLQKTGPDFPIIFRLAADERMEGGFGLEDAIKVSKMLEEAGVSAIDIVSGAAETDEWLTPSMYMPRAYNVDLSAAIKKEVGIPVMVTGRIDDPYLAESILQEKKADLIGLGRPLLADPEFPLKTLEGRTEDICRCIGCLRCRQIISQDLPLACTVNPATGNEETFVLKPAEKKKRILVIGGGPAGMESALVAARRGHDVTLWDKAAKLGGQLNIAMVPPHKDVLGGLLEFFEAQLRKAKVKIALHQEATANEIRRFSPDAVILATGSRPAMPGIEGINSREVFTSRDVLSGKAEVGKSVIVIGGGQVGCETAHFLADKGKKVTITEILPELASDLYYRVRKPLLESLEKLHVKAVTSVQRQKITESGMMVIDENGARIALKADSIVVSIGSTADRSLYQELKGKVAELYEIGDCVKPRSILEAVHEGADIALRL